MAKFTYLEAIRQAQFDEMQRDPTVFLMGEDLVCNVFGTATGLVEAFGTERVRDTPISENGFIGAAAGAACLLRQVPQGNSATTPTICISCLSLGETQINHHLVP